MEKLNKQGLTYAEWQKQKYAVKSMYKNGEKQNKESEVTNNG